MDLYEYQGKDLFRRVGIPVSEGRLATTPEEAREPSLGDRDPDAPEEILALVLVEVHRRRTLATRRRWTAQFGAARCPSYGQMYVQVVVPPVVPVVPVVVVPVEGGAALIALPAAETTYHLPPKKFWRWPEICPAPLSSLYR